MRFVSYDSFVLLFHRDSRKGEESLKKFIISHATVLWSPELSCVLGAQAQRADWPSEAKESTPSFLVLPWVSVIILKTQRWFINHWIWKELCATNHIVWTGLKMGRTHLAFWKKRLQDFVSEILRMSSLLRGKFFFSPAIRSEKFYEFYNSLFLFILKLSSSKSLRNDMIMVLLWNTRKSF